MSQPTTTKKHKHFVLDQSCINQAQKLLGTKTEKDTIGRALEEVISEGKRSAQAWKAHKRFSKSGIEIRDVYGVLSDTE